MAQHSVAAQYGAPDLALQQQMAAQGRLPGGLLAYVGQGSSPQNCAASCILLALATSMSSVEQGD
jgi:hypothetical protein